MGKARIIFGTNTAPGPEVECEDSLEIIRQHLVEQWVAGHRLAVIEAPGFKLIVEKPYEEDNGLVKLRPLQR